MPALAASGLAAITKPARAEAGAIVGALGRSMVVQAEAARRRMGAKRRVGFMVMG
ncbi:hypothetical protein GCM10022281_09450 [Sphingomonas rosea]|uniref:Uncharacterized protein n=1 Tax=Sphingomonas rosea TaxID=335605 RepID=A0ABP7TVL5_9SPHN